METIRVDERSCYPVGFLYEFKGILKLAWPTSLSILFHYFIQPVSLMFCGHLGKTELASVALALSMIYMSCISIGRGLAFGGDTFFSQTYGSTNKKKMGVYLQKGILFGIMCSFFIWAILINTETILLLLRQEPQIAKMAQEYTGYFMPGVLAYCWIFTLMRYLLCQNSVIPNLLICMVSCGINAILHYCFIFHAGLGIRGSAISLASTYYLVFFLLVSYIWGSGIYKETWDGWSRECLEEWGSFGKVAVSSIFMTFIFWFCTEVGTFLAGLLSEEDISAFSICFQVEGFAWMIPLGLGSASTARIGQYLGGRLPQGAITTCRVALTIQAFISVLMALSCYLLRFYIPMAFTNSSDLVTYTGNILPLVALFLSLEGFGGVGISIVRGTGRQTLGAVIIFVSFYVFALPVGVPLMFVTTLKLAGLWWGYILGLAVQNLCLFAFVARVNWHAETDKAQIRAGIQPTNEHLEPVDQSEVDEHEGASDTDALVNKEAESSSCIENDDELIIKPSLIRLILIRLPIFIIFVIILVAGVCLRLFVSMDSIDCIHANLMNASTLQPLPTTPTTTGMIINQQTIGIDSKPYFNSLLSTANISVPWCNDTSKYFLDHQQSHLIYNSPFFKIWI